MTDSSVRLRVSEKVNLWKDKQRVARLVMWGKGITLQVCLNEIQKSSGYFTRRACVCECARVRFCVIALSHVISMHGDVTDDFH